MKTLLLHIGSPKTGTSAIQVFLAQHHHTLKKMGIFYPGAKEKFFISAQQGKISSGNGFFLAKYFRNPNEKKYVQAYQDFCNLLSSKNQYTILYSSEAFWSLKRVHFEKIYELCKNKGYEVKIILFLRGQKEMLLSLYAQEVKARSLTVDIYHYYKKYSRTLDYEAKLRVLRKVFGLHNLNILKYTTHRLLEDFLDALGMENKHKSRFDVSLQKVNPTPDANELEFLRTINQLENSDRSFSDRLLYTQIHNDTTTTLSLPNDLAVEMDKRFAKMNESLAQKYKIVIGNSRNMNIGKSVNDNEKMSPFDEISARMIYSLHKDTESYKKQIERLQKKYNYMVGILAAFCLLLCYLLYVHMV
ncbi:hypothetical protein [Candidatus Uabimicrobium amorphum]|nr:hypothetical protein [Candidatus Uabimicrobium amorphum]